MNNRKAVWILLGILLISAWILGPAVQAGAETLNYKSYHYAEKNENVLVGDVENHSLQLAIRRVFYIFENGEVATGTLSNIGDYIGTSGTLTSYGTITFADGSAIFIKREVKTVEGKITETKGQITKGTGRFQGIKGTQTAKTKLLPLEKGEAGQKGISDGTLTYTLPPK
jgi:hypothetical protein